MRPAEIFTLRDAHPWPPLLEPEEHWEALYTRAAEGLDGAAPATLDEAIALVRRMIDQIATAVHLYPGAN